MKPITIVQPGQLPKELATHYNNNPGIEEYFIVQAIIDIWSMIDDDNKHRINQIDDYSDQYDAIYKIYADNPNIYETVNLKIRMHEALEADRERKLAEIQNYKLEQEYARLSQLEQEQEAKQFLIEEDQRITRQIQEKREQQEYQAQQARKAEFLQEFRSQQIGIHNKIVEKTVSDLRDAEFFHTGQAHYLQQQLAELMAKRF